ncbi:MAG: hypothetical protein FRX49_09947 [Trebouxia sp. A1-2]|nr:MAG: hypothetical protein FRX49_09947 [Trebouxia sp. A1-2]
MDQSCNGNPSRRAKGGVTQLGSVAGTTAKRKVQLVVSANASAHGLGTWNYTYQFFLELIHKT